jgi:hypothetical protein
MSNKLTVEKYKQKQPVIIEAVKCAGPNAPIDIANWCGGKYYMAGLHGACIMYGINVITGKPLYAYYGDYIVKDAEGNYSAYTPEEFEKLFETL